MLGSVWVSLDWVEMFWVRLVGLAHFGRGWFTWLRMGCNLVGGVCCWARFRTSWVAMAWVGLGWFVLVRSVWANKDSVSSNQVGLACSGIAGCVSIGLI